MGRIDGDDVRRPPVLASGIAPWRRPLGDEPAEPPAVAGHELVERVDERGGADGSQPAAERVGQADLREERHAPAVVAGKGSAVAEDEPPTLATGILGHGRQQTAGLLVLERKQGQLMPAVERGDDPRRPAAELSAAGVEQNGARKARNRRRPGVRVLTHAEEATPCGP